MNNKQLIKQIKQELDINGELLTEQISAGYLVLYFNSASTITKAVIALDAIGASTISGDFSIVRDTAYVTKYVRED